MRTQKSLIAIAAACCLLFLISLNARFEKVTATTPFPFSFTRHEEAESTGGYPYVKPTPLPWHPPIPSNRTTSKPPNRAIILAKLEHQDTSRVTNGLSEWQSVIHTVDNSFSRLYAGGESTDRGRIADAYLRYIIDNYYRLPTTMVFLNPARNDYAASNFDISKALQDLDMEFIQTAGFASLRCSSQSTCRDAILPFRSPPDEFRVLEVALPAAWKDLFNKTDVPVELAAPCCSEFAVSRDQVQKRAVDEYLRYWSWLHKTKMDDDTAGFVFEYLWHLIFGRDAMYCPEVSQCECDLYRRC
ncbi:hypothetical protein BU26DRAFT_14159 [Trematosphaeria pertusa]|uniref:Uncharacterized protein n=1 Tax=Trematosphaeria pertusa TaxID=390896 RepID=A0A6A6J3N6_9PLEO|nr:uncharacterized protein BU26DRAFT_14159 [Trematosphaeria pertusa]KAF2256093.1 hypothetical protein BU26DRAFT_14159 [Trematosphaeria pertusa]